MNQDFKEMIQHLLPLKQEQDQYFEYYREQLKKSLSIQRHRNRDFETHNPNFILSQGVFDLSDTYYVDRKDRSMPLGKSWQHLTGEFYIQEVAASLPANILKQYLPELYKNTQEPLRLLDVAAAPGGKTTQLGSYLLANNIPGIVWGNDIESKRLKSWTQNIQRSGLYNTVLTKTDGTQFGKLYLELFDAILVDVPCSGEGTGFKSDDAFKRRRQESINQIAGLQEQILESTLHACKVGGLIVYSTCTLNPYENEYQITKLLERYGDAIEILPIDIANKSPGIVVDTSMKNGHEDKMLRAWPHIHHTGGFFVCVIRKTKSTQASHKHNVQSGQLPFEYNAGLERKLAKTINKIYGINLDLERLCLVESKHHIHLADASTRELLKQGYRFQEVGVPLLKKSGRSYSLEHNFGMALGASANDKIVDLTTEQLQSYALGEDIKIDDNQVTTQSRDDFDQMNKFYILKHRGKGVSVGKVHQGMIKNKFLKW